jgi:alkylresorcinol/alkylpyrone synthase
MNARLVSLATAVPPYTVAQGDARTFARDLFRDVLSEDNQRLLAIFEHAGIESRNVCAPLEWYGADHGFAEKNALYVEHAVRLSAEVAAKAMQQAGLTVRDIDHLVFSPRPGRRPGVDARWPTFCWKATSSAPRSGARAAPAVAGWRGRASSRSPGPARGCC